MSSPPFSSPTVPSQGRKIAPLPLRPRSRPSSSSNFKTSRSVLNIPGSISSNTSSDTHPSNLTATWNRRNSYSHPIDTRHACRLSPPGSNVPGVPFHFGQEVNRYLPTEQQEHFTFRLLHNITPRLSPEPEEATLSSQDSSTRFSHISLQTSSRPQRDVSQPLPAVDSNQGIELPGTHGSLERGIPKIVHDSSYATLGTPHDSSSSTQVSDLNPSPSGTRQRSISDASVLSDNNDVPSPYDVRDEEAPSEPFFTPTFQTALQDGMEIAKSTVTAVERLVRSSESTGNLERLLNDAQKLRTFQSSDTRTIAVLGDSGQGKSSLINALLHFPEIAKTGDIGAACTSVVTEYRQKTPEHTAPITIEVEYLSKSEIEDLVKELLWNYRQVFLPDVEEDTIDPKEYARYQRESDLAWSALEAGFKHQRSFNKTLLSDMSEGGLAKATDLLIQWAHGLEWPGGDYSGTWKSTADTAEECCEMTSIFMQDRFWPFTKIIRVYLSAQVLKTGVILADLPGLQDTNLARVRATQTYLHKCDIVFIVANISRAISDQSLKSSLYSILARHVPVEWEESAGRSLKFAIVCTKSEEINLKTARRDFSGPQKKIPTSVMEQLDKDIEDAKKNCDKSAKKQLKRKQEMLLVEARNSHVKKGLRDAYSSKITGGQLEVFCVSNKMYEKYSRKGNIEMVQASGIPELRRFCHTITAGAQLLEANHFLQSRLSSLLNSVELWATSSARPEVEDRVSVESIKNVLQDIKAEVSKLVDQYATDFKDTFREVLSEYLERRNQFWEDAADAKGREWQYATQYNAWCLNYGNHQTSKRGPVNWNSELIWKMRLELAYQWDLLEDEIPKVFSGLLESITSCFLKLRSHVRAQGFVKALAEGIDFRLQDIEFRFGLMQNEFLREVKLIHRYASEPNETSYIVSEMVPAYRAAAAQSGTGKAARQRSIVQGRITNGTLFPLISAKIQENMDQLVHNTFNGLQDAVGMVVDLVDSDIDMALASTSQRIGDAGNQEDKEAESRIRTVLSEIGVLKVKHEEILASVASM